MERRAELRNGGDGTIEPRDWQELRRIVSGKHGNGREHNANPGNASGFGKQRRGEDDGMADEETGGLSGGFEVGISLVEDAEKFVQG